MIEQDYFSEEEKVLLREQLKRGHADAKAVLDKKGVKLNPRMVEHNRKLHAKMQADEADLTGKA